MGTGDDESNYGGTTLSVMVSLIEREEKKCVFGRFSAKFSMSRPLAVKIFSYSRTIPKSVGREDVTRREITKVVFILRRLRIK